MDLLLSEVPGSINRRRLNSADQVKFPLLIVNDEKKILIRPIAVLSLKLSLWQCGSRDFNFSLTELARHLRCHDVAGSQISSLNYSRPRSFRSHVKGRSPAIHIQTVITENIDYQAAWSRELFHVEKKPSIPYCHFCFLQKKKWIWHWNTAHPM